MSSQQLLNAAPTPIFTGEFVKVGSDTVRQPCDREQAATPATTDWNKKCNGFVGDRFARTGDTIRRLGNYETLPGIISAMADPQEAIDDYSDEAGTWAATSAAIVEGITGWIEQVRKPGLFPMTANREALTRTGQPPPSERSVRLFSLRACEYSVVGN